MLETSEANMELSIKNIGKIKEADVSISGITVIAGENNTGKSTVGKVLFSLISSMYRLDQIIAEEKKQAIMNVAIDYNYQIKKIPEFELINNEVFDISNLITEKIYNIAANKNEKQITKEIKDILIKYIQTDYDTALEQEINKSVEAIYDILKISNTEFIKARLTKNFNKEFDRQINNIFSNKKGEIELKRKKNTIKIEFIDNKIHNIQAFKLLNDVVYIDNPFLLDEIEYVNFAVRNYDLPHKLNLILQLRSKNETNTYEEILVEKKLKSITDIINKISLGDLIKEGSYIQYKIKGLEQTLRVKNLSAGIKTFAILKQLISNGVIRDGETIILDEPEIHLHPEWQLVFAELIVLLQKNLNVHILLTTHSPYFLNAIEVFSKKHGIQDKCNYYIAVNHGHDAILENVNGNLERIYSQLARPLQDLENEEYRYDDE